MIQQMISIVIISQVVSLVQISSSYYIYKLRYQSGDGKKMCTLEGLVKIRGEYLFSTKALNIPLSKMFKLKGWITIFSNRNCDIVYQLCTAVPSLQTKLLRLEKVVYLPCICSIIFVLSGVAPESILIIAYSSLFFHQPLKLYSKSNLSKSVCKKLKQNLD